VLVLLGGVAVFVGTREDGPRYPEEWDARVLDLVRFDEKQRGLTFKHPVEIEFMTEEDFKADVTTEDEDLSEEDRLDLDEAEAGFRALGLIGGEVDLFDSQNDIRGGGTLAYYSTDDKKVRVRGTELDVATEVTLVHELTHALQDQHFDLSRLDELETDGEATAFRALVEGDATVVENAYIDQLSPADTDAYFAQNEEQADTADYRDDPQVLVAMFTSPYVLGPPFVEALKAEGGNDAVNEALQDPPRSEAALLDIFTYLDEQVPVAVDLPAVDETNTQVDDGDFGATTWFLMLAQRIDVHRAIEVVDGWAGDSYVTYTEPSSRVCVTARYQGKEQADTDRMYEALKEWVMAEGGRGSTVNATDSYVELDSCDPGPTAELKGEDRSMQAIEMLGLRLQVVSEAFKAQADDQLAECASNGLVDRIELADLDPAADQEAVGDKIQDALTEAIASC
jgi:hypothetical protein